MRRYKDRCKYNGHPLDEKQISALEKEIRQFFVLQNEKFHSPYRRNYKENVWFFRTMNSFDYDTLDQIARETEFPKPPENESPKIAFHLLYGIENYRLARSGITHEIVLTNADAMAFYEFIAPRINKPDFPETWKQLNQTGEYTYEIIGTFTQRHFEVLYKYLHQKKLIKKPELSK